MSYLKIILSLVFITSCTTASKNTTKNELAKKLFDIFDRQASEISDSQIASIADKRPDLVRPFNLAVYFKQPNQKAGWRWESKDREGLLAALPENKQSVKNAFELINTLGKKVELSELRLMAAQQGADALLVIQGVGQVESKANGLALTYFAVLPMLFANGNDIKSAFVTQAALWDVRHSSIHFGAQSEGDWEMKRPLVFGQYDRALEKAKEESVMELERKLSKQLTQIKSTII